MVQTNTSFQYLSIAYCELVSLLSLVERPQKSSAVGPQKLSNDARKEQGTIFSTTAKSATLRFLLGDVYSYVATLLSGTVCCNTNYFRVFWLRLSHIGQSLFFRSSIILTQDDPHCPCLRRSFANNLVTSFQLDAISSGTKSHLAFSLQPFHLLDIR